MASEPVKYDKMTPNQVVICFFIFICSIDNTITTKPETTINAINCNCKETFSIG